jgi:hypothetical protein
LCNAAPENRLSTVPPAGESTGDAMAGFIQVIEFQTSRIEEIEALLEKFRDDNVGRGDMLVQRGISTADRDRPGYYLNIVEFDSYEAAMENSNRPETSEFAAKLGELCDGPAKFYNLDVRQTMEP